MWSCVNHIWQYKTTLPKEGIYDACHEKTDLKVFVVVIPKGGSESESEFDSADVIDYILEKSVSYQKKDGRGHAHPFFLWYDNNKDLKACFLVMRVIWKNAGPKYKVQYTRTIEALE